LLEALRDKANQVCPPECAPREIEKGGHCVPKRPQQASPSSDPFRRDASPALAQKPVPGALSHDPAPGALRTGQIVLVDDGSCPRGQIKELAGGTPEMLARHLPRAHRCIPR